MLYNYEVFLSGGHLSLGNHVLKLNIATCTAIMSYYETGPSFQLVFCELLGTFLVINV